MKGPIFITGMYRTGSTLISRILNQHPELEISYDRANFFRFYLDQAHAIETRYRDVVEQAGQRFKARWDMDIPLKKIISRIEGDKPITFSKTYKYFMLETFQGEKRNIRWGEKTLLQWSNIPLFLSMFPDGQALHIMRDPRSIAASQREITWEKPYRYLDVVFACLHSMSWARAVGASLPKRSYMLVRYEDLIQDPEGLVQEICGFLEVDYKRSMLDTSQFKDQDGNHWVPNSAFGDVKSGFSTEPLTRWRTTLERWEVLFVESLLEDLMGQFGYEPSDLRFRSSDLALVWEKIRETPLIQRRLQRWFDTGQGVECYSSDPRDPKNWAKHKFT